MFYWSEIQEEEKNLDVYHFITTALIDMYITSHEIQLFNSVKCWCTNTTGSVEKINKKLKFILNLKNLTNKCKL